MPNARGRRNSKGGWDVYVRRRIPSAEPLAALLLVAIVVVWVSKHPAQHADPQLDSWDVPHKDLPARPAAAAAAARPAEPPARKGRAPRGGQTQHLVLGPGDRKDPPIPPPPPPPPPSPPSEGVPMRRLTLELDLPAAFKEQPAFATRESTFRRFGFDLRTSNRLPLHRVLPDYRMDACKATQYPRNSDMPKTTVRRQRYRYKDP